jgi:phosphoserine phosphatase RsbU/P
MLNEAIATENCREWVLAREVQRRFMQHPVPAMDTLDYSARVRQVHELGGDCYDFVPLADQRLALVVGDASGKGLAGALMISNVQSSLRTAALFTGSQAASVVGAVNRQVYASSFADRYATLFYGVFDPPTRSLTYVNAGHNPPFVMRRGGSIEWLETGGPPVGMFPDWHYEEGEIRLGGDDVVLAYTDGVTEAVNPCGEEWGVEGLERSAMESRSLGGARCAQDMVAAIFRAMDEFTHGKQADDATIAMLRVR